MKDFELGAVWFSSDDKNKDLLDPSNIIHCLLIDKETGLKYVLSSKIEDSRSLYKEGTNDFKEDLN